MKAVLLVLAVFFIVATALPFLREPYWWIRIFDFPRAQLAAIGVITVGLYAVLYERTTWFDTVVLVLVAVALAVQLYKIWPYTGLHATQSKGAEGVAEGQTFRLVISNVLMDNRDAEKWLGVIRAAEPDLVVAVETDDWWAEHTRSLEEELPYAFRKPMDNTYGFLVFSRWPLGEVDVRYLVEEDVPSLWGEVEVPSGVPVKFTFIHPRPPRPDIFQDSHARDAELVLVARAIEDEPGPRVVAGDLNDVAWSYTTELFQEISGLLDPRIGRGLYSTFHADHVLLRWPLDHVFHSDDLQLVALERLGHVGSDHFPMLVEFAYEPDETEQQEEPEADAEDEEEADEILEDAAEWKRDETPEEKREKQRKDR
jgi:endonuclease/exonuclease/phosphatase (EEP) superfamily protein YafD